MEYKALISKIKKQHMLNRQLMVGDIVVVNNEECWQVSKIYQEPGGFLTIVDENGNGFINVPPNNFAIVINRNCIGS
jgi:hypothetical protein